MTVREVPAAPPPRRGGGTLSPCTIFSEIFNILQQQKSGEPQLPAFFYVRLFPPFLWRQFSAVRLSSSSSRSM